MGVGFGEVKTWRHGWEWFRENTPRAASRSCWGSVNGEQLLAKTIRARSASGDAASPQPGSWAERVVSATAGAQPPERGDRGVGEQAAANGVGRVMQERAVSAAGSGRIELRNWR